ncbi:hypothetical protein [Nocardia sp. NBC_00416]|uniref:hypothetical protein n=1 Tax=Nocardia sp. NBC_00416 TaxID=2975991 RepID=UPI002E1C225A
MSETKDPRRTRRRASRTAGPPPAEELETGVVVPESAQQAADTADRVEARTEKTEAPAAKTAAAAKTEKNTAATAETTGAGSEPTETGGPAETVRLTKPGTVGESAAAEPDADDAETDVAETAETRSGRSWKRIVAVAAAAVLVIGLVGAAVVSTLAVQSTQQRDERRSEYVATARQTVLNLTTIRADTAKEDIDRILTMASGDFKTEFDGRIDPFTEIVKQAKVVSTGEVVEAAVERDDEKSAVILIAAKQTLTNAGSQEQQQRFYRFRVTVQRADDGTLTASDVKFVA